MLRRRFWTYLAVCSLAGAVACDGDDEVAGTPDSGTQADTGVLTVCQKYCTAAMTNCTGANELYPDNAACEEACNVMDEGTEGEQSGNTLECRRTFAELASGDASNCAAASLSGGNVCGEYCDVYCDFADTYCSNDEELFPDRAACMATCAVYPTDGTLMAGDGNSVQCRINAAAGAANDAPTFCPSASTSGGTVCGTLCDAYCDQVMDNCQGNDSVFMARADCMASCAAYPAGDFDDEDVNTVQCRTYFASHPAAGDADMHCYKAAASGGGACGAKCDAYCDQTLANCTGANELYPDRTSCEAACSAIPVLTATTTDTATNSVDCRIFHASYPAAGDATASCPSASVSGNQVCGELCDAYCDQNLANCTFSNKNYGTRGECLATCAAFPSTFATDTSSNSVQCRANFSSYPAAQDPVGNCAATSANGGGVCGDRCDGYCDQVETNCTDTNAIFGGDRSWCLATCANYPVGTSTDTAGNTVQCRTYYASHPATTDAVASCANASIVSVNDTCGTPCEAYCHQDAAVCTNWTDIDQCLNTCPLIIGAAFEDNGGPYDMDGNTVQCRANNAAMGTVDSPTTYCTYSSIAGGGVCID